MIALKYNTGVWELHQQLTADLPAVSKGTIEECGKALSTLLTRYYGSPVDVNVYFEKSLAMYAERGMSSVSLSLSPKVTQLLRARNEYEINLTHWVNELA